MVYRVFAAMYCRWVLLIHDFNMVQSLLFGKVIQHMIHDH